MADSTNTPEGFSLKRWSRRKLEAAQPVPAAPAAIAPAAGPVAAPAAAVGTAADATSTAATTAAPALPPVESLTHDSDFSAFMQPQVDELVKRSALKKLFTDPHFNVMDGLDIYVGDYTQADPMPAGMLEKLGKVYAAVTHDEDADAPVAASAAAPETVATASPPERAAPAVTATPDVATDTASTIAVQPPAPAGMSAVPSSPQDSTVAIRSPAQPSGKPQ